MNNTVLITGANRGIGLEFVRHYLAAGDTVIGCCRAPEQALSLQQLSERHPGQLELVGLDVTEPEQFNGLSDYLQGRALDLVINNAGTYGPKGVPFGQVTPQGFSEVMQVNVLAPLLLVQSLIGNLERNSKVAIVSSKMGSISDNQKGGAYFYRASKSAVNAIAMSLSRDLGPRGISVVSLHPGWVQTDMGGPQAHIDAATSVAGMAHVIEQLTLADSGKFINYDGSELAW
ncbi:SDR family oxidoreductase [Ferrimonas senticii]|uniref:SDR family oxidoreductase n=1 Tax=Ferrimonas senticii TaxID=394566 RepID=UPI0004199C09|nr:SDR family oxidoreductase [Ferrimonas senticii]